MINGTGETFAKVRERFLTEHCAVRFAGRNTFREYKRVLTSQDLSVFDSRPIDTISRREVIELLDRIAARALLVANRVLQYLRSMMNWAASKDLIQLLGIDF